MRWESLWLEEALDARLFETPTELFHWPARGGLAVSELRGNIVVAYPDRPLQEALNLRDSTLVNGEMGLLSVAADPEFDEFPYIYVYYAPREYDTPARDNLMMRLSRFAVAWNGQALRETELVIIEIPQITNQHNGGAVRFGPDGMLYLGVGDGGHTGSGAAVNAQRMDTPLGNIIRINVRGATAGHPYRIPEDNPFRDMSNACPEIYAYGLRNTWRMSFDPLEGTLWVGDVSFLEEEEISVVRAWDNLGWDIFGGTQCRTDEAVYTTLDTTPPLFSYKRGSLGIAIVGGTVYRGDAMPWLNGAYIFADWGSGRVFALYDDAASGWAVRELADFSGHIITIGVDGVGEVYVMGDQAPARRLVDYDHGYYLIELK